MASQVDVPIDQDNDPLLDDVGIKSVFFVTNESFLETSEALEPNLSKIILDVDQFFKEEEKLTIALRLEILEALKDEFVQG